MRIKGFFIRILFVVSLIISTTLLDYFYHDLKLDMFFITLSMLFPLSMTVDKFGNKKMRENFLPIAGQIIFLYIYLLYTLPVMFIIDQFLPVNINYIWGVYLILAIYSHINYINFQVKKYEIKSDKISKNKRIVFFSDVHINEFSRKKRIDKLVEKINSLEADIVINGGDLIDSYSVLIPEEVKESIKNIKYKEAFIGVMGNHEHHGNANENRKYIEEMGMLLLEEKQYANEEMVIVGRKLFKDGRKSIESLKIDNKKFIVNVDHVPSKFDQSVNAGVDLNLSGHTHAGQFFPINFLYKLFFPMIYGYKYYKHTHVIVSSGFGTSFIPFRNLNIPEIIQLDIFGENHD